MATYYNITFGGGGGGGGGDLGAGRGRGGGRGGRGGRGGGGGRRQHLFPGICRLVSSPIYLMFISSQVTNYQFQ